MNEHKIETLLRKSPAVQTPPGLRQRLENDITLPQASQATGPKSRITQHSWLRRWLPSLGLAVWLLGCLVVLGIQGNVIEQLRSENAQLAAQAQSATVEPQDSPAANPEVMNAELERLRKDAADVERLRVEIAQLKELLAQASALRAANEQLRQELKSQIAPAVKPEDDLFAATEQQKEKAQRIMCVNNLKQVCLGARIWANDNGDVLPTGLEVMIGRELPKEKVTFCPADGTTRYDVLSPGVSERDPQVVYVRCSIHNNVGLVDGSVHQIGKRQVVQQNGKWYIEQQPQQ